MNKRYANKNARSDFNIKGRDLSIHKYKFINASLYMLIFNFTRINTSVA